MSDLVSFLQDIAYNKVSLEQLQQHTPHLKKILAPNAAGLFPEAGGSYRTLFDQAFIFLCQIEELPINNVNLLLSWIFDVASEILFKEEDNKFSNGCRNGLIAILENFMTVIEDKTNFEEMKTRVAITLADLYEFEELWIKAAKILSVIPFGNNKDFTNYQQVDFYLKIVRLYLEGDDPESASDFINRLSPLIDEYGQPEEMLQFKVCQARILTFSNSYTLASTRYYEISRMKQLPEEDQLIALLNAIKCIILSEHGSTRMFLLRTYYKDERSKKIEPKEFYYLLENLFIGRIIKNRLKQVIIEQFLQSIGSTFSENVDKILNQSIIEHNLRVCAEFYTTISFERIEELLEIPSEHLEEILAEQIRNGKIIGRIDQFNNEITFYGISEVEETTEQETEDNKEEEVKELNNNKMYVDYDELEDEDSIELPEQVELISQRYNERILSLCRQLENVVEKINYEARYGGF